MDREISSTERRRRLARRLGLTAAVIAVLMVLLILVFNWIRPSVRREDLRTALVERGPVEATISASGSVMPAYEPSEPGRPPSSSPSTILSRLPLHHLTRVIFRDLVPKSVSSRTK